MPPPPPGLWIRTNTLGQIGLSNNINISVFNFDKILLPPGRPWVGLNVPREKDPGFRIRTKTRSRTLWSSRRALWPGSHLGACVLLLHLVALFCIGSQSSFENQNIMLQKLLKPAPQIYSGLTCSHSVRSKCWRKTLQLPTIDESLPIFDLKKGTIPFTCAHWRSRKSRKGWFLHREGDGPQLPR